MVIVYLCYARTEIRSNLLEGLGIEVTITRVTKGVKCKVTSSIRIQKVPPIPPIHPVGQNHQGNLDNCTGGILDTGDIIPPAVKIPPVKDSESGSQN